MQVFGIIHEGLVVLDEGALLPEGARVCVSVVSTTAEKGHLPEMQGGTADSGRPTTRTPKKRVEFPLVRTGTPGSLHLTNEQIHEILEKEDIEALTAQWNVPS